jgi:hypothetical protein
MIILQQYTNNEFPVTASMNVTISNPVYLFQFQHKLTNEYHYIIPYKVPTSYSKPSYDMFLMNVDFSFPESLTNNTSTSGNLHLIPGEYLLRVYQQTSTSNLDPALSQGEIYQIMAVVNQTEVVCEPEPPYTGGFDDEWIVYDECQPTPIVSLSATANPTPTPTPTPSVTPTNTPTTTSTLTPTPTNTGTPTNTPTNTTTQTSTPTSTQTSTPTQTPTSTETPVPSSSATPTNTPTNTETPTNTPTNTATPTNTPSPTPTIPPLDCTWSGTTSLWENNINEWQECSRLPQPTPSATPTNTPTNTETGTPTPTPTNTETPTNTPTPTNTGTPTNTPTNTETGTPTPTPTNTPPPPLMFLVSSGATQEDACGQGPSFYVYAQDLGNCQGCLDAGVTCWACLSTSQQVFADPQLTIPVGTGYYSNETMSGSYQTWYIVGGFPQAAGFTGCPFGPTPTPTATVTQTPTNTITPTPSSTDFPGCITIQFDALSSACSQVTLCGGNTASRCYSAGQGQSYCIRVVDNVPQYNIISGSFIVSFGGAC